MPNVLTRATPAQLEAFRKRRTAAAAPKKAGKKRGFDPKLVEPKYSSPRPGLEIFEVPCYLPSPNRSESMLEHGQAWQVHQWRIQARNGVFDLLHKHLPHWLVGDGAVNRSRVNMVVLSRISPGSVVKGGDLEACDDDNATGSCKPVRDAVCAWLVHGHDVYAHNMRHKLEKHRSKVAGCLICNIGRADRIVYSPVNPKGYLRLICDQEIRPAIPYKKVNGVVHKRVPGRYGVIIELHVDESSVTQRQ